MSQPSHSARKAKSAAFDEKTAQPRIWAEGQQNPPFDLRAFLRVSHAMARRSLAPRLTQSAAALDGLALRVDAGEWRVDTTRLGRAAALVPSTHRIAAGVTALARTCDLASTLVLPAPPPDQPLAYPNLTRSPAAPHLIPLPRRPTRPDRAEPTADAPTLHAIRSIITAQPDPIAAPLRPTAPQPAARSNPARIARAGLQRSAATVLSWLTIALFFPGAATAALLLHLNGDDLRTWD